MLPCQRPPKKRREPIDYPDGEGGREILNLETAQGLRIYKSRTLIMAELQNFLCAMCGLWMAVPTFDHADNRCAGHQDDRILDMATGRRINAALCVPCQGLKGSKRYAWVNGKYTEVVKIREVA